MGAGAWSRRSSREDDAGDRVARRNGFAVMAAAALAPLALAAAGAGAGGAASSAAGTFVHSRFLHSDQTWGGFGLTGGTFSSISGSWRIPALNCGVGAGSVSPWIGIDGWANNTVEQIGLDLDCSARGASFHPWVEMYPAPASYFAETVRPGDTINASVTVVANAWTLTESDPNEHWSQTFHKSGKDAKSSAEAVVEDLGTTSTPPPVDDFGTLTFTGLTVNGHPFFGAGTVNVTSLERGTLALSRSARLSATSLSVTWLHR